jgi:hypothetical protein
MMGELSREAELADVSGTWDDDARQLYIAVSLAYGGPERGVSGALSDAAHCPSPVLYVHLRCFASLFLEASLGH